MIPEKDEELHRDILEVLKKHNVDPITCLASLSYLLGISAAATGMTFESFKNTLGILTDAFKLKWEELSSTAKLLILMKGVK